MDVSPNGLAEVEIDRLRAIKAGTGKANATVGTIAGSGEFTVSSDGLFADGAFDISPKMLEMSVYEFLSIDLLTNTPERVTAQSSNPSVAEVLNNHNIVARSPGEATVTFRQGDVERKLQIKLSGVEYERIWVESPKIVKRPGQRPLVRMFAR